MIHHEDNEDNDLPKWDANSIFYLTRSQSERNYLFRELISKYIAENPNGEQLFSSAYHLGIENTVTKIKEFATEIEILAYLAISMNLTWKSKNIDFMIDKMQKANKSGYNKFEWDKVINRINKQWEKKKK